MTVTSPAGYDKRMDFDDVDGDAAWWTAAFAVQHAETEDCDVCCYFGLDCVDVELLPAPHSGTESLHGGTAQ
jgi:hypothetical protein